MAVGGRRPGSGSKKGAKKNPASKTKIKAKAKEMAKATGELPHEWLLKIAEGHIVKQKQLVITLYKSGPNKGEEKSREWIDRDYYPTFHERVDAAKAAAPFYAPKLATQTIKPGGKATESIAEALTALAEKLPV